VYVTRIGSPPFTEAAVVTRDGGGSGVTGSLVAAVVGVGAVGDAVRQTPWMKWVPSKLLLQSLEGVHAAARAIVATTPMRRPARHDTR